MSKRKRKDDENAPYQLTKGGAIALYTMFRIVAEHYMTLCNLIELLEKKGILTREEARTITAEAKARIMVETAVEPRLDQLEEAMRRWLKRK